MKVRHAGLALAALALLLPALAGPAAAHKTTYSEDGSIKIVWGFLNEPAVTHTKTGLDLILSMNETGDVIAGAETTLNASLVYGNEEHRFEHFKGQHGKPGRYTDVVTLTQPGLYSLRLQGIINGTAVDMTIPAAHEVAALEDTYFPEASGLQDLEARLAALEQKLQTRSATPAPVTDQDPAGPANPVPAPGALPVLAALGVAALVALRRRS